MKPIIDPRQGDIEDDVSAIKSRSLLVIAGSLLAEISPIKFFLAFLILIVVPAVTLGLAPLLVTAWLEAFSRGVITPFGGLWSLLILGLILILGAVAWRPLYRIVERGFWSLNSLAVQPGYILGREISRHWVESFLGAEATPEKRARIRSAVAFGAGVFIAAVALLIVAAAWPGTRWIGEVADIRSPLRLLLPALANSLVLLGLYLSVAALVWGTADATMTQPRNLAQLDSPEPETPVWRVAHLSDLHSVGGPFEFRIESGRNGPRGNIRLAALLDRLESLHARHPLDLILMSGDMTDAGRSTEWAAFLDALGRHPALAEMTLMLPGNHDLNVVDRANPARLALPSSPGARLRQMRTLSAMEAVHGARVRLIDANTGQLGPTLTEKLEPFRQHMEEFSETGGWRLSLELGRIWMDLFPLVLPPREEDGLGVVLLNSNSESHFSFTNAMGFVSAAQAGRLKAVTRVFPKARWIVALHHHLVEYPRKARALSERIGTALINGSWFLRYLGFLSDRAVAMHGHRHIDWTGECGGLRIISAPSPVMGVKDDAATYFHIQRLAPGPSGRLSLLEPERVVIDGVEAGPRIRP